MNRYHNRKSKARMLALQAVYQWQASDSEISQIQSEFNANEKQFSKVFFAKLINGVSETHQQLDELYAPYLDREIKQLDRVEKALLRLATFELAYCPETPTKVVIDEAIFLAKEFAGDKSYKYINAILDKLSQSIPRNQSIFSDLSIKP